MKRGKTDKSYHNTYNLHRRGMKTTNEFGDILKEELGLEEDKRMKLPLYPIGRN